MDRRKLKIGRGLHNNLVGSQISSKSGTFDTKSLNEGTSFSNRTSLLGGKTFSTQSHSTSSHKESFVNNKLSLKEETLISKNKTLNDDTLSRKRKSSDFSQLRIENDSDLGLPLAESTIIKKRRNEKTAIQEFLTVSGIKINPVAPHILCNDIIIVQQKMKESLNSKKYKKEELINFMEKYFENDQNLENALFDMELFINDRVSNVLHSSSLIKILLQVSELHPEIYNSLLTKLNESVLMADSIETIPWALSLLQQFRFLDVVINSDILTNCLEQFLESCPVWFQRELILYLPDMVTDKQHQTVAEILNKVLEENSELISLILNCMSNLNLAEKYLDEYKNKILNLLKTNIKVNAIPAVVKFVLQDCTDIDTFKNTLTVLRDTNIQPLAGENVEECYQNQLNIINALKMYMFLSKNTVTMTLEFVKNITKDPKPLDIIILLLIFSTTETKRKNVETIFKQHIRSGFYRASLLNLLYNDYKQVVQELQIVVLQLSSNLLKTSERVFIDFAIDWFRLQFICHKNNIFKQREVLERIVFLMGDNDQTIKNALAVLCTMVTKEEERQCLAPHCNHLRILLEKLDNLDLEEVGTLNDLLQNLCISSTSVSDSLRNDLFILLQKQLSNFKPQIKSKGVLAAVMAIKHLMKTSETSDAAYNLFKTVLNNVRNCQRSKALFYDQLIRIITQVEGIDADFIKKVTNYVEEEFINENMIDKDSYKGELVPKYGLNKTQDEPQNCVLTFENKKYGAIVAISFKLLKTCCIKLSKTGDLDAIDSLLGCAILMPESFDVAENTVIDLIICCINWFREVISGFVTQKNDLLQKQVLQRLDNLIYLQSELSVMFSLCDTKYQPPPCYFHHFPLASFVRIEKKVGKKGKKGKKGAVEKSVTFSETESWELGSLICSKNPIYFRKLDTKIVHLLDIKMELNTTQSMKQNISVKQVCFILKELLGMFEYENTEIFIKDLIEVLPKICSKLQDIVDTLREESNNQNKEAVRLILCLLTKIFNWKGFESVTYNMLLREGLRTVASQVDENNAMLRSCKELVTESCKYFESLADVATQISLAIALINMCQSLMKHSESYTKQNKEKYANMAFGFLCLQWSEDKHFSPQYKTAVIGLLNSWIDNEPLPLNTVTSVLEWLPDETSKLEKSSDCLNRMPSIKRSNFHLLFKKIFDGLINGIKIALSSAERDSIRVELWGTVASNVQKLVQICKTLTTKNNILIFLKHMPVLLKSFLNLGMPVLEHNLKYHTDDVTKILKMMQGGTRYLHTICCDSVEKRDLTLTKYVPVAKSVLERLLYSVKGMLVLNNSTDAFWMGNLINKNLEGQEILSQNLSSEENTLPSSDTIDEASNNVSSDILESDSNNDLDDEDDIL
ncbi:fancd2 isoform X2 [Nomia melanderi]|uniref:fancd2 isoform X2 n=1 Tax=Nomia melanderi TaxID=2448451 RepID=UPI0013041672|nr:Fanconi anemia group D2 protein homolog isoform X2 [Nomia melanderi]